ncbi:MoxR family ATPase [Streptomyces sp. B1866]|uniref:AAA family ATPase n=1 Tax=Streptomyces sp. B1866 TaxID=3075431 RepID=UPI00288CBCB1|nr:MoxR family ATPase [Streptomyces sp. B1866]MDT3395354.1 MoxR family ATPase [Streptomyces sp. B1866]
MAGDTPGRPGGPGRSPDGAGRAQGRRPGRRDRRDGPPPTPPPAPAADARAADWLIYNGGRVQHDGIDHLPDPPPWRRFDGGPLQDRPPGGSGNEHAAASYRPHPDAVRHVNAALYLRRPLLVTGPPGTGKSTLAYAVAHELKLGPVLHWPITSRTTLQDGLYQYDPLTRLYAQGRPGGGADGPGPGPDSGPEDDIGRYIRLGPLGTALLPYERPRVLLIDEIDKSDIDLPGDLLTVFEKGSYDIVELARREAGGATVMTADSTTGRAEIADGTVTCHAFPLVIMTSNGEREFPPAFLRRCVSLKLRQPAGLPELTAIVAQHLGGVLGLPDDGDAADAELPEQARQLVERFYRRRDSGLLANDQLLNAVYLCHHAVLSDRPQDAYQLADQVMPFLSAETEHEED